jgi:hypothetical protein
MYGYNLSRQENSRFGLSSKNEFWGHGANSISRKTGIHASDPEFLPTLQPAFSFRGAASFLLCAAAAATRS